MSERCRLTGPYGSAGRDGSPLVAAFVAMGIVATSEDIEVAPYGLLLPVGLPTLLAFYGSSPTERVYEVAPKHTDPMWSTGPSPSEAKKPNKSK